ncbi:MAG: TPM domain-containing protein [Butyricicoccus sp.]|nr:TPM domain-containing protein [Butyricicoccus sp.]
MKKKCFMFLCLLLLWAFAVSPAYAAGASPRLVDRADYLTDSEEAALLNKLDEISTRQGLDVVIVTIPDLFGEDITALADDFYDEGGYHPDGILLLISDYDREWAISTAGYGITAFTDAGQEYLTGQFLDALSEGEYAAAFDTYAGLCDAFITQAKTGTPYDMGMLPKSQFHAVRNLLISVGIGLLAAWIAVSSMKAQLKTVRAQTAASAYVKPGSMHITERRELFLYHQIHRTAREVKASGGSSTHTSSSGRTHGGSSGTF